jgi:uncharacterized damage-inducible protein DinB
MKATEAIQGALRGTQNIMGMYLADLSDADLLVRPVPNANHIAWQLGHLIDSERSCVTSVFPDARYPELPPGFSEKYTKEASRNDAATAFHTKAEYLKLFNHVREATLAAVGKLSDADLDKPNKGQMAQFAPTIGALLLLVSNHTFMHGGQFTVVRRKLGKPVIF